MSGAETGNRHVDRVLAQARIIGVVENPGEASTLTSTASVSMVVREQRGC